MEVPTILRLFGFGVRKLTLLASQNLLSLFQGDPNSMTFTLKVAFRPMSVNPAQSTLGFPEF